jgi:hypothetical protein
VLIYFITYPKQYKRLIIKETKKVLQEGDNSSIFGKKTIIIEEDDLKVISEDSTETTSKASIKDIKVYDDMILIYMSGITAHIIPTRYLDEETKNNLLDKLRVA